MRKFNTCKFKVYICERFFSRNLISDMNKALRYAYNSNSSSLKKNQKLVFFVFFEDGQRNFFHLPAMSVC